MFVPTNFVLLVKKQRFFMNMLEYVYTFRMYVKKIAVKSERRILLINVMCTLFCVVIFDNIR